jgi:hypothetical protein
MVLIAQQSLPRETFSTSYWMIALIVVGFLASLLLAGVWFGYLAALQARKNRELLHLERIKAFESGILWQEPGSSNHHAKFMHNAFYMSFWIVSFGCGGSFAAAGRLSLVEGTPVSVLIIAWLAAAASSIAAVVCATILMIRSKTPKEPVNPPLFFRPPVATLEPMPATVASGTVDVLT